MSSSFSSWPFIKMRYGNILAKKGFHSLLIYCYMVKYNISLFLHIFTPLPFVCIRQVILSFFPCSTIEYSSVILFTEREVQYDGWSNQGSGYQHNIINVLLVTKKEVTRWGRPRRRKLLREENQGNNKMYMRKVFQFCSFCTCFTSQHHTALSPHF